jgi:DNA adenine methylase
MADSSSPENFDESSSSTGNSISPRPFVKWAGGKKQLIDDLTTALPARFNRYWEPFLGGGALFFSIQSKQAFLSDVNSELVNTYTVVRDSVDGLITELKKHVYEEAHFYSVRDWDRAPEYNQMSPIKRAARFIFLNKTCFNGLHRVNSKGHFNVPFGRYSNPTITDELNLRACSHALSGARIEVQSYLSIEEQVEQGDLVYLDPPYVPVSETSSFTSYTKDGFGFSDQIALRDLFSRLASKGAYVMLSNSDSLFVEGLYQGFNIKEVSATRAINAKAADRGPVGEFIITNY